MFKLLAILALVAPVLGTTTSLGPKEQCFTSFATTKPATVFTTTTADTVTQVSFEQRTSTPSVDVTVQGSTITQTTTIAAAEVTTTLTQLTDSFTSTSTVFETSTIVSTSITTETSTSTATSTISETATVTIPTPAGFTPINPAAAVTAKKREERKKCGSKPSVTSSSSTSSVDKKPTTYSHPHGPPTFYPAEVTCTEVVNVVSTSTIQYTAAPTTQYVTPPVSTDIVTSTYSNTVTVVPTDVSTTITVISTSTVFTTDVVVSTTTIATTTTTTVEGAAPTYYAACANNNILSSVNGIGVFFVRNPSAASSVVSGIESVYDCCVACMQANDCVGSYYELGYCAIYTINTCNGAAYGAGFYTTSTSSGNSVSNGACGQLQFLGVY